MSAQLILPRCPVCGAINQADRRQWDYFACDEFACRICRTVWYQDPLRPLERLVLVRGKWPFEQVRNVPASRWVRAWAWAWLKEVFRG